MRSTLPCVYATITVGVILLLRGVESSDDYNFLVDPPVPLRHSVSSVIPSVGGSIDANPVEWSFFTVIVVPVLSCDLTAQVPSVFDSALRAANPDVVAIKSVAVRLGSDVCVDGLCFCDEWFEAGHTARVLEVKTVCGSGTLFLPTAAEFPYEYDARDQEPPPIKRKPHN